MLSVVYCGIFWLSARRTKVSRLCSKTDPLLVYEGNLFLDVDWRKHQPSSSTKDIIPRNLTFAPHNPVQEVENSLKIMDSGICNHIYIYPFFLPWRILSVLNFHLLRLIFTHIFTHILIVIYSPPPSLFSVVYLHIPSSPSPPAVFNVSHIFTFIHTPSYIFFFFSSLLPSPSFAHLLFLFLCHLLIFASLSFRFYDLLCPFSLIRSLISSMLLLIITTTSSMFSSKSPSVKMYWQEVITEQWFGDWERDSTHSNPYFLFSLLKGIGNQEAFT